MKIEKIEELVKTVGSGLEKIVEELIPEKEVSTATSLEKKIGDVKELVKN